MKNTVFTPIFIFLSLLLFNTWTDAQTYFKVHESSNLFSDQIIARFPDGDLLIGSSSRESLSNGGFDGKVFLSRIDPCGNIVWSYSYVLPEGHLELKDFKINEAEKVFLYGSFYLGLQERIFLLKVDGKTGENGDYKLFHPGTVDHVSLSMDLKDGQIMIFGLLLDFNTQKQGFIAIFNTSLGFLWGKTFTPFESTGAALIGADHGFIGRSGKFLIKMDQNGDTQWALLLDAGPSTHPVSGPQEVAGGFILEAHREGFGFFYKINFDGMLVWQSDLFPATNSGSAMSLLADGNVQCTYNCPEATGDTRLCQLQITPEGRIFDQRQLMVGNTFNTGRINQSINTNNIITIAGNANPFATQSVDITDFVLQYSLDTLPENCMFWENFEETIPNNINTTLSIYDPNPIDFNMLLEQSLRTDTVSFKLPLKELCETALDPEFLQKDTLLPCGVDWMVSLPGPGFIWQDGTRTDHRQISFPGTYKARKRSCSDPVVVHYTLEKEACGCQVYLPNAFSPNQDGINDQLQVFSDCTLDEMEFTVFNRWGSKMFHSNIPGQFWDGTFRQKKMPSGVYLVTLAYQWTDFDGKTHKGNLVQDVTLLR